MVSMQRTLETEDNLQPCMPSRIAESAAESRGAAFSQSCRLRRRSASPAEFATAPALEGLLGRVEELELELYPRDELPDILKGGPAEPTFEVVGLLCTVHNSPATSNFHG